MLEHIFEDEWSAIRRAVEDDVGWVAWVGDRRKKTEEDTEE